MDNGHFVRMIEWLDEERRRDKLTIATLEERMKDQQGSIDTLMRRLNSLESDNSTLRATSAPAAREPEILDQIRREVAGAIEQLEARRLTAERETDRRMEIARESISRPVRDIADKVTALERRTVELPAIGAEKDRLSGSMSSMQQRIEDLFKRFEEPDRRITLIEEQRRQDIRRLTDLETEAPELRKAIDNLRPKVVLIEDIALRNERKITEIANSDRDRREGMQQFVDQATLMVQQRDQQVQDLIRRFGDHDTLMQTYGERVEMWAETQREMKRLIDDFNRMTDRLERDINQIAETQRLSEERFRQEWNAWREEDGKRWRAYNVNNDEVWRRHDLDFDRQVKAFEEMQSSFTPLQDSINRLWSLQREIAQVFRERFQTLVMQYDNAVPGSPPNASTLSPLATGAFAPVSGAPTSTTSTGTMRPVSANGFPSKP